MGATYDQYNQFAEIPMGPFGCFLETTFTVYYQAWVPNLVWIEGLSHHKARFAHIELNRSY